MTDEEIRKMAQSYGESVANSFDYDMYADPDFKHRLKVKGEAWKAEQVLIWLSKDYCIVPKSKLQDEYAEASNTYWQKYSEESQMDSRHDVYERGYNVGIMNVMEDIFGKDMFEEGKK